MPLITYWEYTGICAGIPFGQGQPREGVLSLNAQVSSLSMHRYMLTHYQVIFRNRMKGKKKAPETNRELLKSCIERSVDRHFIDCPSGCVVSNAIQRITVEAKPDIVTRVEARKGCHGWA